MPSPKDLQTYYNKIKNKGIASFPVIFTAAPGDDDYSTNKPVAKVRVLATDPNEGNKVKLDETRQMSEASSSWDIEAQVLTVTGVLQRYIDKYWNGTPPPKPFDVTVTVTPESGYEGRYESRTFALVVKPGANGPQHVFLAAKERPGLKSLRK